jgi:hypothetical protein
MKNPFKKKVNTDSQHDKESGTTSSSFVILEKIAMYFNPQPQKEKVLRHEDFNRAGDTYYATVSAGYKITQRLITVVLVFFLVLSLITNFNEITYDNFFYLIKDFADAVDVEQSDYDTVSYTSDSRHFFSLYRGGLVVVNPSTLAVYTATGRNTMNISSRFSSPCVESSDKYFAVYDTAGTTFSVYNAFSRIYSENFEYPITGVCFADDESVAVVTKDISHRSLVHIYNKNFKKKFTVPSDKYAFDIAIDSDSDRMAVCYYDIGDGSGVSQIVIRKYSNMEEVADISINGEFVLKCGFISQNRFGVITNRSVRIYDKNFDEWNSEEYAAATVSGFYLDSYGAAIAYTENSKNIALIFDKTGNLVYNDTINDNVKDIGICEQFAFFRTDSGIIRIDTLTGNQQFLPSGQGRMLLYGADTALVCGDSKAEYLVFDN